MKKSRLFFLILFLAITLAGSLRITVTMGYYAIFTENFIERYCENKERPELQCDGKCYLAKMLLQESNDDTPPIHVELLKNETILFMEKSPDYEFFDSLESTIANYQYTNHYEYNYLKEETHPPRL